MRSREYEQHVRRLMQMEPAAPPARGAVWPIKVLVVLWWVVAFLALTCTLRGE